MLQNLPINQKCLELVRRAPRFKTLHRSENLCTAGAPPHIKRRFRADFNLKKATHCIFT